MTSPRAASPTASDRTGARTARRPCASRGDRQPAPVDLLRADRRVRPTSLTPPISTKPPQGRAALRAMPRVWRLRRRACVAARHPGALVLAGDTVVACGRRILPKAEDEATARTCLALLSGRRHQVLSAITLIDAGRAGAQAACRDSIVTFKRLPPDRDRCLYRERRMARQGRRLCHPGRGGRADRLDLGQPFRRRRTAALRDDGPAARRAIPAG